MFLNTAKSTGIHVPYEQTALEEWADVLASNADSLQELYVDGETAEWIGFTEANELSLVQGEEAGPWNRDRMDDDERRRRAEHESSAASSERKPESFFKKVVRITTAIVKRILRFLSKQLQTAYLAKQTAILIAHVKYVRICAVAPVGTLQQTVTLPQLTAPAGVGRTPDTLRDWSLVNVRNVDMPLRDGAYSLSNGRLITQLHTLHVFLESARDGLMKFDLRKARASSDQDQAMVEFFKKQIPKLQEKITAAVKGADNLVKFGKTCKEAAKTLKLKESAVPDDSVISDPSEFLAESADMGAEWQELYELAKLLDDETIPLEEGVVGDKLKRAGMVVWNKIKQIALRIRVLVTKRRNRSLEYSMLEKMVTSGITAEGKYLLPADSFRSVELPSFSTELEKFTYVEFTNTRDFALAYLQTGYSASTIMNDDRVEEYIKWADNPYKLPSLETRSRARGAITELLKATLVLRKSVKTAISDYSVKAEEHLLSPYKDNK